MVAGAVADNSVVGAGFGFNIEVRLRGMSESCKFEDVGQRSVLRLTDMADVRICRT
tara:strand:- start:282 stop:449 length:168 start_codon:yes stop_codon:yes gene_type:complete